MIGVSAKTTINVSEDISRMVNRERNRIFLLTDSIKAHWKKPSIWIKGL